MRYLIILSVLILLTGNRLQAQCFASAGNPIGGTANMGVMDKNTLRMALFHRFSYSNKYKKEDDAYTGSSGILDHAFYNYSGWLIGYGLTDWLTLETEGGFYENKTQVYLWNDQKLTGNGLSNAVISLKPRLYYSTTKRFEISCALGANIPFSRNMKEVDGVVLPIDLQPSTGSYGLVFQTFLIKENSFRAYRLMFTHRFETYFANTDNFLFGNLYQTSIYFSRHFVFDDRKLKDWTLILQLKNQFKEHNFRDGIVVNASGNLLFYVVPQVNLSLREKWNISLLADIPVYQYYNGIQLSNRGALGLSIVRDFKLGEQ